MRSVVATGRRMKTSERFMAPPARSLAVLIADAAAGHEPQLAVGHDRLARPSARSRRSVSAPLVRATATGRSSTVWSASRRTRTSPCWPVWTATRRHDDRVGIGREHVTTLTNWPGQSRRSALANVALILIVPVVWSTALSTKVMRPTDGCSRSSCATRLDAQRALRQVLLEHRQLRFGNAERHVDRRDLVDDDQRRRVVGAHEIALVDHQRAGAAGDRRGDRRVLELDLGVLDGGAVGADRRLERRRGGARRIDLLARRDAARGELLRALAPGLPRWPPAPVALQRRLRPASARPRAAADRA